MAHGDAREGKWRGNWRMEWVASTPHTTSEHGVSSITTADAHTSAASCRLNWRPCRFKWTRLFQRKRNLFSARVPSHFKRSLPPVLTFQILNPAHSVFIHFVLVSEKNISFPIDNMKWLSFVAEMASVSCAVRTGSLRQIMTRPKNYV
jgi:hypothetical protein